MRVYTPPRPQRRRRKRLWPKLSALAVVLVCAAYAGTLLLWPVAIKAHAQTPDPDPIAAGAAQLSWPVYGQSAIGTTEGGVLATSTPDSQPVPIASITKTITVLTVLQAKPLTPGDPGPVITFTAADAALYNKYISMDGSVARATAGMQLSEYQVIQGMLISSANNYADTLAAWAYGSMDAYLAAAQAYLASQQLEHTHVVDASGFSPDSQSTASDLIRIGSLVLKNPVLADIVSQRTATIPGVGLLYNTNQLLGSDGVTGIKTGTTDQAGDCLLFAANYTAGTRPITIVGAVLGAPAHNVLFRDVTTLLKSAEQNFQTVTLTHKGQVFANYKTPWGSRTQAVAADDLTQTVWAGTKTTPQVTTHPLDEASAGKTVGSVNFTNSYGTVKTDLILTESLNGPSWQWRLLHPLQIVKN